LKILEENKSLKAYNTFGIEANAAHFLSIDKVEHLQTLLKAKALPQPLLILGGGSNLLFTKDWNGTVLQNNIKGIEIDWINNNDAIVKVGSGEIWHQLVLNSLILGLGGLENLSLIPGTVGAAPMQNIGAYGVEIKTVFHQLEALNLETLEIETFNTNDCNFGYRESVFKHEAKNKYFIASVSFRLSKNSTLNTSYGAIEEELMRLKVKKPTHKDVSNAVVAIRQSKLPDPVILGNAGSFFKNPAITITDFKALLIKYPDLPSYPLNEEQVKVPAGWLIEHCGWKGKKIGETGSHKNQALVLVNYGNATGIEIYQLSKEIIASVKAKFKISLNTEVNII
jgi:UDP-N-acetylmuramate dehydrogenase